MIFAGALALLASCSKDHKVVLAPDDFVASEWIRGDNGSIFSSGDEVILSRNDAEDDFAALSWSVTDFGYSAAVTYSIQVARQTGDGTAPEYVTVATTQDTEYDVKVKDFNAWCVSGGAVKAYANDMLMRIAAVISSSYPPVFSEAYRFRVNVFSTEPDRLYFVSDRSQEKLSGDWALAPDFNGKYDGFVDIPYGADGVWLVEDMHPDVKWGIASPTEKGTKLKLVRKDDGGQPIMPGAFGEGDTDASFTAEGYYRIKADFGEGQTLEIWRFYKGLAIVGQRNMNYSWWAGSMKEQIPDNMVDGKPWRTGAKLTYCPEERVWKTESVFVPKEQTDNVPAPAAGNGKVWEFKLRANNSWGPALEGGGSASDKVDNGIQSGEIGIKNIGGATGNIRFNGEEGWYHWEIYLGERPFRYRLVPDDAPEK